MSSKTIATLVLIVLLAAGATAGAFFADRSQPKEPQEQQENLQQEENTDNSENPSEEDGDKQQLAEEFAKEKEEYYLLLANPDNPLPEDWTVETQTVQGDFEMDSRVAQAAKDMIEAAANDGVELMVCSAYRSIEKQTTLFDNMKQDYLNQGMSEEEAYNKTAEAIAIPGTSEHQTGLAADIVTPSHQTLDPEFADTDAGKWLNEHAHEYGFILRYPEDKQDITKIMYESWHFRFVGKTHAKLMKESGMCLEEYLAQEVPEGYTGAADPYDEPQQASGNSEQEPSDEQNEGEDQSENQDESQNSEENAPQEPRE